MSAYESRRRHYVDRYWEAHFRRDWATMASFFADDCHYTDVGVPGPGGTGPEAIIARLKVGIEPLEWYEHRPRHTIAEGDIVVTEHVEVWGFHTGEVVVHPFTSVMEVQEREDRLFITRWHDYSNIGNLIDNAPAWWLERIASAARPA